MMLNAAAAASVSARKKIKRMAKKRFDSSRKRSAENMITHAPTRDSSALTSTTYLGKQRGAGGEIKRALVERK